MNPRIKLLFVVGTALTIGRALDLGLWTDLESGLCAVGPVWLRYAALAVGVLAAICIGRKLAHGPQELQNHCKASGTVTIMAGAFFALAALARLAVGLTGIGAVVRAVLEVLCAVWLVLLGRNWLRPAPGQEHGLRHLGHTGVLLVRSEPFHGEQLQLAPRLAHRHGVGDAGGAALPVQPRAGALAA